MSTSAGKRLAAAVLCVGVAAPLALLAGGRAGATAETVTLTAQGTVQAPRQLALAFGAPGRLTEVGVRPGQQVRAGQLLARLDPSAALAAVQTARANLASARAQLAQLQQGLSPNERNQLRISRSQSDQALAGARHSLEDTAAVGAQDRIRLRTALAQARAQLAADQKKLRDAQDALTAHRAMQAHDQATLETLQAQLATDESQLAADQRHLLTDQKRQNDDQGPNADPAVLAADANSVLEDEASVSADQAKLTDDTSSAADAHSTVVSDQNRISSDQDQIATDRDRVVSDRQAITVAANAVDAGKASGNQTLDAARSLVDSAQLSVASTRAANAAQLQAPRVGALASTQAAVEVAAAALATAENGLRDTRLLAPFASTVAAVNAVPGQVVPGQTPAPLINLVDLDRLTVTAAFDGAHAALVASGQAATVTAPELSGQGQPGRVLSVDPLPNPSGGTYTATIALARTPSSLRPGMQVEVTVQATTNLAARP